MNGEADFNTLEIGSSQRAQLAYKSLVVALRELGSDERFSRQTSLLLGACAQLQQIVRDSDHVR